MIAALLTTLVRALFPKAPAWLLDVLADAIPAIQELVGDLAASKGKTGPEKFEIAVRATREAFDAAFDDVPEWHDYDEAGRDRILSGLVELMVFVAEVSAEDDKPKRRKAMRALRTAART